MLISYNFETVKNGNSRKMEKVRTFLTKMGLGVDADVELFVIATSGFEIVGCGGLAGNTLKSIAVDDTHQGNGLSTKLLTELVTKAYDTGRYNLFIYTKPENYQMFHNAGFYQLTSVKDRVILLENSKNRLERYCNKTGNVKTVRREDRQYRNERQSFLLMAISIWLSTHQKSVTGYICLWLKRTVLSSLMKTV